MATEVLGKLEGVYYQLKQTLHIQPAPPALSLPKMTAR